MPEFTITICNTETPEKTWKEEYTKDLQTIETIEEWARDTIQEWNDTLRPHEKERTFISARIINHLTKDPAHLWSEKKNLVTKMNMHGGSYDEFTCLKCGVEGKRYGLGQHVTPSLTGDCKNNL